MNRLLTLQEVAELFGVSRQTVSRWAQQGLLTFVRTPGGHRRFPESEVLALLADVRVADWPPGRSTPGEY